MYNELTNEEKLEVLKNHIRNFEFALYNFEVELLAEQALSSSDPIRLAEIEQRIADVTEKQAALEAEVTRLSAPGS